MSKLRLILGFFIFGLSSLFAQDTLTVSQAVERVLEQHPAITQANQNVLASEARVQESTSALYPNVATEGSYTFLAPVASLSFPGLGLFKLYPASNYDVHVGGRYTVYDFGKVDATINLSRSRVESMRDAVDLTKSNLAYQTIGVFYSILFLQRSIQVQDEQIGALNQHLITAQRRLATGSATDFDVLTTRVRVAAAQSQKIELENALRKQQAVLSQLLGLPFGTKPQIRGDFEHVSVPTNSDSLLQAAVSQRTEIKLARDAEKSAQLQDKLASLGNKPSLKVNLEYGLKNGYIPNLDVLRGNWVANISAEVPIFDGWRTDHQQEEAQAAILAEQAHRQEVERQVRSDVEQAVADVQSAASKIAITQLQVRQSEEAVSIAQTRYETGTITNLDLLDAQAAESASKLGNLQALYRLMMSKYELKRAIGATALE